MNVIQRKNIELYKKTELEKVIVQPLINSGLLKFYVWYDDDALVLVKCKDLEYVCNQINTFHSNLKFTVDEFLNDDIHFLELKRQ